MKLFPSLKETSRRTARSLRSVQKKRKRLLCAEPLEDRRVLAAIAFSTSDSQFDAGVDNQGWWSPTDPNRDSNDNYIVGRFLGEDFRNFFTFDLSTLDLSTEIVTSATLEVRRYDTISDEATETYELFDVSTDAATLNNNVGTSQSIYDDLGTGNSYGSFVVDTTGVSTDMLSFALNSTALADITVAAGGFFSIGGSLPTAEGYTEYLFGFSHVDEPEGVQRLVITTAPASLDAVIDVKPGSDVNPVNLNSKGVLPVAVLSTQIANGEQEDLDATEIELDTIALNGTAVDARHAAFEDVDNDGDLDLMLHFRIPELVDEGVLSDSSVDIALTAELLDGTPLSGSDSISPVPPNGRGNSGN